MRITTCFTSAMDPVKPLGSARADDAELRATLAAAEAPLTPTVAAAAAPSPVACRKRRRLRPGTIRRSGCRGDPAAPSPCSRGSSELVIAVPSSRSGCGPRGGSGAEPAGDHEYLRDSTRVGQWAYLCGQVT